MKSMIRISMALFFVSMMTGTLSAQKSADKRKAEISFEIDPITFISKGYSAHLRIKPGASDHLLLGAGTYAMEMPAAIVNLTSGNKNQGWDVRLNQGYGLFGEHFFSEVNRKFFLGVQTGIQQYKLSNESLSGNVKYTNALAMGYGGYAIQPFDFPLYFKIWGGLGYTAKISGENVLQDKEYQIAPLSMFATLHIGYTFK
ncbi:MAG: hypothetical protein R3C61_27275 [Bacteroidia bacterium]